MSAPCANHDTHARRHPPAVGVPIDVHIPCRDVLHRHMRLHKRDDIPSNGRERVGRQPYKPSEDDSMQEQLPSDDAIGVELLRSLAERRDTLYPVQHPLSHPGPSPGIASSQGETPLNGMPVDPLLVSRHTDSDSYNWEQPTSFDLPFMSSLTAPRLSRPQSPSNIDSIWQAPPLDFSSLSRPLSPPILLVVDNFGSHKRSPLLSETVKNIWPTRPVRTGDAGQNNCLSSTSLFGSRFTTARPIDSPTHDRMYRKLQTGSVSEISYPFLAFLL
jgi:hypothetical protein